MAELKPCPFCGGEAKMSENTTDPTNSFEFGWIGCQKCRCFINYYNNIRGRQEAIEAWNKRTERPKGRWVLTAHEESCNYRWNVTAECSECSHSKGEIYAGFFPGFPKNLARDTILNCAESVKLDNFCPNCGADMRGESE